MRKKRQLAEPVVLECLVDDQPPQPHTGYAARQLLAPGRRLMAAFEFGERQRAVGAGAVGCFLANGDEGLRQPLVLMLAGSLPQPCSFQAS